MIHSSGLYLPPIEYETTPTCRWIEICFLYTFSRSIECTVLLTRRDLILLHIFVQSKSLTLLDDAIGAASLREAKKMDRILTNLLE